MQFRLNQPNVKKGSSSRKLLLAAVLLILVGGGAGTIAYIRHQNNQPAQPAAESTESDKSVGEVPTYETETEGQTIKVPSNVNSGSIKNYELITENEQFKIRKLGDQYTITLYAIINNPSQRDTYLDQLREYKQNALDYLQKQGVNTSSARIVYEPDEATNL